MSITKTEFLREALAGGGGGTAIMHTSGSYKISSRLTEKAEKTVASGILGTLSPNLM